VGTVARVELIFLHGPAASGKLTTARALEALTGYPAFHNHLVVDPLATVFPFGSEPFVRLREQFWTAVFADAARAGRSITFTFTPEPTVRAGFPDRVRTLVEAEGGRVCFVRLRVSEAEQERRIDAPDRRRFHKLTSVETLRRLRAGEPGEAPPADLDIDTDTSDPARSAAAIAGHFTLVPQRRPTRYPEP
jgi:chloramphenicol 3-O-phosphotransferase